MRLGLYGLDAELADYVRRLLLARWPRLLITVADAPQQLPGARQQLWICGREPPPSLDSPALWLDGYSGDEELPARIGPTTWRLATPLTSARLLQGVARVLAA